MLRDAGSPGVQKQIVKHGNLLGMEDHYQQTLLDLENVIKVTSTEMDVFN